MRDSCSEPKLQRPERTRSLTESMYARLRYDILTARLSPGTKLRVSDLCERYGFSSTPVREALMLLASEGFVRREDMRGFFVAEASTEEFLDLIETRCLVEEGALSRSMALGGDDWEARIVVAYHRLSRVRRPAGGELFDQNPDWVRWHDEFHDALIAACGSKLLVDYCQHLRDRSYRYRRIASFEREEGWLGEHEAVMSATLDRDAERAVRLLKEHYRRTAEITLRRWSAVQAVDPPSGSRPRRARQAAGQP